MVVFMKKRLHAAAQSVRRRTTKVTQSEKIRFGLVGVINTFVDFVVLNVLVGLVGVMIVPANIISTTTAMVTSFGLNKKVVFRTGEGSLARQLVLFFAVTLSAVWLVQSGVMFVIFQLLAISTQWHETIILNIAKLGGICAGLVWNYIWYSKVVFRHANQPEK